MTRCRDSVTAEKIARYIKKERDKKFPGWGGKTSAAKAFGTHLANWSAWENGTAIPNDPTQRRLAKFFGVSLAELRGDKSPPTTESYEPGVDMIAVEAAATLARVIGLVGTALEKTLDGTAPPVRLQAWADTALRGLDAILQASVADKASPDSR